MTDTRAHHQYDPVPDLKAEALRAIMLWLDTLAPEDRVDALAEMTARLVWWVEKGH